LGINMTNSAQPQPSTIEERERLLAKLLRSSQLSIVLNKTFEEDVAIVFREGCRAAVLLCDQHAWS
jgi:hypothetical protein